MNERIEIILGRLVAALERRDERVAIAEVRNLRRLGFSREQIEFVVFLHRKSTGLDVQEESMTETSTERSSRVKAILWSGLYAVPTIIGAGILQWIGVTFGYLVIVLIERWFGGVILGALSGLAVGDYRVWLEGKRDTQRLQATRAYNFWTKQKLVRKVRYLVNPTNLKVDLDAFEVKKRVETMSKKNQLLQGYLVLRFSQGGWTQFIEGVNFERGNLTPRMVFVGIAIGVTFFAVVDTISAGIIVGIVLYLLMMRIMPFLNVAVIYIPTLLRGVDPGQSANASGALRVITTQVFLILCLLFDILLIKFGLPKVGLLDLF
jgi:hypothetical protein